MACLFGLLAILSPRVAFGLVWLLTDRVDLAFSRLWVALLGLIFLPWTALIYTLAYDPVRGVSNQGWAMVFLAFLVDVYSYVRGAGERSRYVRTYWVSEPSAIVAAPGAATVELLWIPLGAGARVVRLSGRTFEAISALAQRRDRCALYHSALVVGLPQGRFTIEMTPVPDRHGDRRGVVGEGPVGLQWAGRLRLFRYEIRCWRDGVIPDAHLARETVRLPVSLADATRLVDLVASVPTPVWGRDELGAGEMWNSNSVTSWLLARAGFDLEALAPPDHGRAPGWRAGVVVANDTSAPAP
jgi:hypothetical protein